MTKEEKITELLIRHGEPMTAREITDALYGTGKEQALVFGKLQDMVRDGKLAKVGIKQPYQYALPRSYRLISEPKRPEAKVPIVVQAKPEKTADAYIPASTCKIEILLHGFFSLMTDHRIEIYNEFSLQHELGLYLRQKLPDYKVQFERNVSFFYAANTIKKEIDIVVYNDNRRERYAIELKHPLNGQYPGQMYSFVKDIKFLEELKAKGFTKNFAVVLVNDKPFYEGVSNPGIYRYFRGEKSVYGKIHKPTGIGKASDFILLEGSYKIQWLNAGSRKYYIIAI